MEPDEEAFLRRRVKVELRRRLRAIRRKLPAEAQAARSAAITQRVLSLPEFKRASTLMAYVSIHQEADPSALIEAAWASGKTVLLPRVEVGTGDIVLHSHRDGDRLVSSDLGVPEPPHDAEIIADAAVDLVLVPAMAVDPRGHRIGYGKGYYDRLLPRLTCASSCALVYDFQLISEAPEMPGDVPVGLVVTDARLLRREATSNEPT